jgi:hypothetical protein
LKVRFLDSSQPLEDACTDPPENVLKSFLNALNQSRGKECASLEKQDWAIERIAEPHLSASNDAQRPKTPPPVVKGVPLPGRVETDPKAIAPQIVKAPPVPSAVQKVPPKVRPNLNVPDESVFYDGEKLRCPLDSEEILSPLKNIAVAILQTQPKNKAITQLQEDIGKISTEKEPWTSNTWSKLCKNDKKWISILTRFTALQLIINRQDELQTNSATIAEYVKLLSSRNYEDFSALLLWATEVSKGKIHGLLTSIFILATRFFINQATSLRSTDSIPPLEYDSQFSLPAKESQDAQPPVRADCFVCMLSLTKLDIFYGRFLWMNRYLVNKATDPGFKPDSFEECNRLPPKDRL